ncbi:MAG TPA: hypothetical protein VF184_12480 [Phycisphaeraceae bacterium]
MNARKSQDLFPCASNAPLRWLLRSAAIGLGVLGAAPAGLAATTVWVGSSSGGVFNDNANWSSQAPGNTSPADLGIFNSSTNVDGTITFTANATHYRTFVQNTAGTITFDVGNFKWTMSSFFLTGTGAGEKNTIRHIGGQIESQIILLGNSPDSSNNSLELTGENTLWHTTYTSGAIDVGSGGSDNSTLLVHNGADMTSTGQLLIGLAGSSHGKATVTGDGSTITLAGNIGVGHTGSTTKNAVDNRLEVLDGGSVTASHILMAITDAATDNTILVSAATLHLTGNGTTSDIGRSGVNNTLRVENNGAVTGGNYFILGRNETSTGNQIVLDQGSLTGTGIEIRRGSASITQSQVDLTQFFNSEDEVYEGGGIVATNGAASTVTFNSGTIAAVIADINNGSAFTVGDGGADSATYRMKLDANGANGIHNFANGLFLNSNGVLEGSGDIVGNVSGASGAAVSVGLSAGVIHVEGDWDNTGISILLEISDLLASLDAGQGYDLLDITGAFTHGGSVTIDVTELVAPSTQQIIKLIGWGSATGDSASTAISFIGGPAMTYSIESDGLYVTAVPEPASVGLLAGLMALLPWRRRPAQQLA